MKQHVTTKRRCGDVDPAASTLCRAMGVQCPFVETRPCSGGQGGVLWQRRQTRYDDGGARAQAQLASVGAQLARVDVGERRGHCGADLVGNVLGLLCVVHEDETIDGGRDAWCPLEHGVGAREHHFARRARFHDSSSECVVAPGSMCASGPTPQRITRFTPSTPANALARSSECSRRASTLTWGPASIVK